LAVMARFVGPKSIGKTFLCVMTLEIELTNLSHTRLVVLAAVRCSTVPLSTNPFYSTLRELAMNPRSIVEPGDQPGQLLTHPFDYGYNKMPGRRFHRPTGSNTLAQAALALVLGVAVGFLVAGVWILPSQQQHKQQHAYQNTIAWWNTVAALCLNFFLPLIMGLKHEVDPKKYMSESFNPFSGRYWISVKDAIRTSAVSIVITSILAYVTTSTSHWSVITPWLFRLTIISMGMNCYMQLLDHAVRHYLFSPPADIRSIVGELAYDGTCTPFVTVLVQSMVRWEAALTKPILEPAISSVLNNSHVEHEEYQQVVFLGGKLAFRMLHKNEDEPPEAMLEEDVLQITVLESFCTLRRPIRELLLYKPDRKPKVEHPAVPAVRALCVFISGITGALLRCAMSQPQPSKSLPLAPPVIVWNLPAGFLCAVHYAVTGLSRCIATSLEEVTDWRASSLSTLIPCSLEVLFALRNSIEEFATYRQLQKQRQQRGGGGVMKDPIGVHSPELLQLIRTCDEAGADIMKHLTSPVPLFQPPTREWTRKLLAAAASSGPAMPTTTSAAAMNPILQPIIHQ